LNVGQLGTRGLHTFQELAEFGESGEWIVDTVVDLQKRDERLAVGEQRRRVADPFGLRRSTSSSEGSPKPRQPSSAAG